MQPTGRGSRAKTSWVRPHAPASKTPPHRMRHARPQPCSGQNTGPSAPCRRKPIGSMVTFTDASAWPPPSPFALWARLATPAVPPPSLGARRQCDHDPGHGNDVLVPERDRVAINGFRAAEIFQRRRELLVESIHQHVFHDVFRGLLLFCSGPARSLSTRPARAPRVVRQALITGYRAVNHRSIALRPSLRKRECLGAKKDPPEPEQPSRGEPGSVTVTPPRRCASPPAKRWHSPGWSTAGARGESRPGAPGEWEGRGD